MRGSSPPKLPRQGRQRAASLCRGTPLSCLDRGTSPNGCLQADARRSPPSAQPHANGPRNSAAARKYPQLVSGGEHVSRERRRPQAVKRRRSKCAETLVTTSAPPQPWKKESLREKTGYGCLSQCIGRLRSQIAPHAVSACSPKKRKLSPPPPLLAAVEKREFERKNRLRVSLSIINLCSPIAACTIHCGKQRQRDTLHRRALIEEGCGGTTGKKNQLMFGTEPNKKVARV